MSSICALQFYELYGAFPIGDGMFYVETFLSNFRDRLRDFTVEEGCVIAYRAISDAIKINVGIIGEPIDVWTIKNKENAKRKSKADRKRLNNIVLSWKNAEINAFKLFLKENKAFQQT